MSDDGFNKEDENGKLLYCSFCGKSQHEVRKLIAGPSVFVCDECVDLCNDIIREEIQDKESEKTARKLPIPEEIKNTLDEYVIGKQIGQGAYASVRIGLHKPTDKKVALKIYKKYKLEEPNRRKSVKREIKLMEKMKHDSIV